MKRHAYLIMAHNQWTMLTKLVSAIDDERNDIYIHIDSKVKSFPKDQIVNSVCKATLFWTKRMNTVWGGDSLILCELRMLEAAAKNSQKREYTYYHLLSGVDFPLKSQDYIHDYFDKNQGIEFINYWTREKTYSHRNRALKFYFFQNHIGNSDNSKKLLPHIFKYLEWILACGQRKLNIQRKFEQLCIGSQWFSITDDLCHYLVKNSRKIYKMFRFTLAGDEIFLQTTVARSPFADNVCKGVYNATYDACLREMDWLRSTDDDSHPHVWTAEDYPRLAASKNLFARKFDYEKYPEIVDALAIRE